MVFFILLNYGDFLLTKIGCFRLTLFGDYLLTLTRLSEICSLSVKDYDKELGIIHVKKTKGKKERLIPLHQTLIPIFNKYVDNLINRNPCEEYLFPLKDHKII